VIKKNLLNIIIFLIILFFTLVLFFIFYRSEIYSGFSRFDYYKKYYFITLFFIFCFTISYFFSEKIKIISFIILFIISSTVYSFEIYLHYIGKPKYDTYKEYKKRLETNTKWAVQFPPSHIIDYYTTLFSEKNFLPLSGISNVKTLHCNENDYWATYESDRYGFNNQDKIWDSKIDIALIGDSYTAGACVNSEDNISGNLQKFDLNVLNLGYGGNGPLIQLASIIEYIPLVETEKILWMYSSNDLDDLNKEKKNSTLTSYLKKKESLNLHKKQEVIDKVYLNYLKNYKKQSNFISIIKLERFRKKLNLIFKPKEKINIDLDYGDLINQDLKKILLTAKRISENNNQDFYFVYVPGRESFYSNSISYKKVNRLKPKIITMVESLNIRIIDLEELLKDEIPSEMFPKKGHYNSKGYQLIAEKLFENLQ